MKTVNEFNFSDLNDSAKSKAIMQYFKALSIGIPYNNSTTKFKQALTKSQAEKRPTDVFDIYWKDFHGKKETINKLNRLTFTKDGRFQTMNSTV